MTLTTVGFGDLTPTSDGTQIFTIIYILTGLGMFVALLASLAEKYIEQKSEGGGVRERLRARRQRRRGLRGFLELLPRTPPFRAAQKRLRSIGVTSSPAPVGSARGSPLGRESVGKGGWR